MAIEQTVDTREAAVLAQITERLCARFPSVAPGEIELIVQLRYDGFAGSRIRDYVPILVERAAGDELRSRSR